MKPDPLVTIGILCYNQEDFIAQAIESALHQDYSPIQIIVSDDNSSDKTRDIIAGYQNKFPDIIEIQHHNPNIGICENMISLFPLIRGDFFCWLAGDDYFLPGKIRAQIKAFQEDPTLILHYHDTNVITEDGNFLYSYNNPVLGQKAFDGNITRQLIEQRCFISALSMMVDMKKIGDLRPTNVAICSDWLFFIEASMKGPIGYTPNVFGVYRRHSRNITKKIDILFEEKVYEYLLERHPSYKNASYRGMAWSYTNYIVKYMLTGNVRMTVRLLKKITGLCLRYPQALLFVLSQLIGRTRSRISLLFKTGSMFR